MATYLSVGTATAFLMVMSMADSVKNWRGFHKVARRRLAVRDVKAVQAIVERAIGLGVVSPEYRETFNDALIKIHTCSLPMDLEALATCRNERFVHDVRGIKRHYNHRHQLLGGLFLPYVALSDQAVREMKLETTP